MKKLHVAFGAAALAVIAAGLIHGSIAWIVAEIVWDPLETSFPTSTAFVLPLLFYGAGALAITVLWLITWLTVLCVRKKRVSKDK